MKKIIAVIDIDGVITNLDFMIFNYNFPIFNLADTFIVIGCIILVINSYAKEENSWK